MKKILLFTLLMTCIISAHAQQTYWTPGIPPSSTSFSISTRFTGTDSLANFYFGNASRWNQFYSSAQSNIKYTKYSDTTSLLATQYYANQHGGIQLGGSGTGNILVYGSNGKAYAPTGFQYNASSNNYIFTKPLQMNAPLTVNNVTTLQNTVNFSYSVPYLATKNHLGIDGSGNAIIDSTRYLNKYGADTLFSPLNIAQTGGGFVTYGVNGITDNGAFSISSPSYINETADYNTFYDTHGDLLALFGNGSDSNLSFFPHLQVIDKPTAPNDVTRIRDIDSLLTGYTPTLGYTPENVANKVTTLDNSTTHYPSTSAVTSALGAFISNPPSNFQPPQNGSIWIGDSMTVPYLATIGWAQNISALHGTSYANLAISSMGVRKEYQQFAQNANGMGEISSTPLFTMVGFNNVRTTPIDTVRVNAVVSGTRAMAALQFAKAFYFPSQGTTGNVYPFTYSSGYSGAPATSVAELVDWGSRTVYERNYNPLNAGANWFLKSSITANETATITLSINATSIAVGTWACDPSINLSRIQILVDGVDKATYDPNGRYYLGYSNSIEGFTQDGICNDAIIITGLTNAIHTVTIVFLDGGKIGGFDYLAVLKTPTEAQTTPLYINDIPHLTGGTNIGYNYPGYVTTQAVLDNATTQRESVLNAQLTGYPIAYVPINSYYTPNVGTTTNSDGIHPTNSGQSQISSAYPSLFNTGYYEPVNSSNFIQANGSSTGLNLGGQNINANLITSTGYNGVNSTSNTGYFSPYTFVGSTPTGTNSAFALDVRNNTSGTNRAGIILGGGTPLTNFSRTDIISVDPLGVGNNDYSIYNSNSNSYLQYIDGVTGAVVWGGNRSFKAGVAMTLPSNATAIQLGVDAYGGSNQSGVAYFTTGMYYDGSNFIATNANVSEFALNGNQMQIYLGQGNTTGSIASSQLYYNFNQLGIIPGLSGLSLGGSSNTWGSIYATTPGSNINSTVVGNSAWVNTYFAPLASPTLTGIPTATTAASGTNTTQIATTAFVTNRPSIIGLTGTTANTLKVISGTGTTADSLSFNNPSGIQVAKGIIAGNGITLNQTATTFTISGTPASLIVGTPTIASGAGAGTSPTVGVTSNGRGLQVTVTTGTLPTGTNATIATITLANALSYTPYPVFSSNNAITSLLSGASMIYMSSTGTSNITITSGTTALTAATTYIWNISL